MRGALTIARAVAAVLEGVVARAVAAATGGHVARDAGGAGRCAPRPTVGVGAADQAIAVVVERGFADLVASVALETEAPDVVVTGNSDVVVVLDATEQI